jgi:hypothetical protein
MSRRKRSDKKRIVESLQSALIEGVLELKLVPELLKQILQEGLWRERVIPDTGEVMIFESFDDFVRTPVPTGLGTNFETLWKLCSEEPLLLDLLDQAVKRQHGAPKKNVLKKKNDDNINTNQEQLSADPSLEHRFEIRSFKEFLVAEALAKSMRPSGTSRQAGLRQLRKHDSELHAKVLAGELSINAALIRAGLRTKQITVFVNPQRAAGILTKAFSQDEFIELVALLIASLPENSQQVADKLKQTLSQEDYRKVVEFLELLKRDSCSVLSSSLDKPQG